MWAVSALVAVACVLASFWRLSVAVAPTSFDAAELRRALTDGRAFREVREAIKASRETGWEGGLFEAFSERDPLVRQALVNELLTELDGQAGTWSRVPRICASLATSAGFLCASISLLRSWSAAEMPVPVASAVLSAVDAFSFGVMGAAFCVVIHVQAGRAERQSLAAVDRLVERMQALSEAA
jgi:hypothetical protein